MLQPLPFFRARHSGPSLADRTAGFTLIELVIVMAVIGLLLTLAVPRYFTALDSGKVKVQQQNIATMRDALDKFFSDQGRYPETLDELVQKRYLRNVPLDPLTENPGWIVIAPLDPAMSGVYDVRSAAKTGNETATAN
jgi:general secretion pathway protein G